jgi:cellulose synthase/poly-beta-1,6-N-acetylglucosamine synthase-like glycosyltransferase
MREFIFNFTAVFQITCFILTSYFLIISFFGLIKKHDYSCKYNPEKSFAIIVAAHDEEIVIANIVESLKELDYPKQLYDIFVIADNCSDKTAVIAKEHGACVYERHEPEKRGKGFALEWMFDNLFKMDRKYDSIVVFDADNLASKNFLIEMNNKLMNGYKVVQGYLDSKNPHDSWISESYSISFWTSNRLFQLSRANLGLSNQIGGTGFCIDSEVLRELGWGATCLTEDLEFSCKLVLNGYKVGWAHNAVIYDEKPLTIRQSWRQRKRWMQGFADVASRFFIKLIVKAIKDKDFIAFDCAIYTVQPFIVLLLGICLILNYIQNSCINGMNIFVIEYLFIPWVWKLFCIFQFMLTPFVMLLEKKLSGKMFSLFFIYSFNVIAISAILGTGAKIIEIILCQALYFLSISALVVILEGKKSFKIFIWYLLYGIYTLTWIPITIQGMIYKNKKEWTHTKHTRQISIQEIEGMDGRSAA